MLSSYTDRWTWCYGCDWKLKLIHVHYNLFDWTQINGYYIEFMTNMMSSTFKLSTSHFSEVSYFLVRCITRTHFNYYVTIVHDHLIRTFFNKEVLLTKNCLNILQGRTTIHLFKFKFNGHITNCWLGPFIVVPIH